MQIRKANYTINEPDGRKVYHFTTDTGQTKVLNASKIAVGNLDDLFMKGVVRSSGSIKDIKLSGAYRIKNHSDMPAGIPTTEEVFVHVKAFGAIGDPDMVWMTMLTKAGDAYQTNVLKGASKVTWSSSGGAKMDNLVDTIKNGLGTLTELQTSNKTSTVEAINEVNKLSSTNKTNLETLKKNFDSHNHDTIYYKLSGGILNGDMQFTQGRQISRRNSSGELARTIGYLTDGNIGVGNDKDGLRLSGKDKLLYNGKQVWHEENQGAGSGLDADKLDGQDSASYALLSRSNNYFAGDVRVTNGKSFIVQCDENGGGYWWRDSKNVTKFAIYNPGTKDTIRFRNPAGTIMETDSGGNFLYHRKIYLNAANVEAGLRFKSSSSDAGVGIYYNNSSQYLGFYNWRNGGGRMGYFQPSEKRLYLDNSISIQGRKLWLQASTPTGAHKVGDIWIS